MSISVIRLSSARYRDHLKEVPAKPFTTGFLYSLVWRFEDLEIEQISVLHVGPSRGVYDNG